MVLTTTRHTAPRKSRLHRSRVSAYVAAALATAPAYGQTTATSASGTQTWQYRFEANLVPGAGGPRSTLRVSVRRFHLCGATECDAAPAARVTVRFIGADGQVDVEALTADDGVSEIPVASLRDRVLRRPHSVRGDQLITGGGENVSVDGHAVGSTTVLDPVIIEWVTGVTTQRPADPQASASLSPAVAMVTRYRAALCSWRTFPECAVSPDLSGAASADVARLEFVAVDVAVRTVLPEALEAIGDAEGAAQFRRLPAVRDVASAEHALQVVTLTQRYLMAHARALAATERLPDATAAAAHAYVGYAAWLAALMAWLAAGPDRSISGADAMDMRNALQQRHDLFGFNFVTLGWTDQGALTATQGLSDALDEHAAAHVQIAHAFVAVAAYSIVGMAHAGRQQADFERINARARALLADLVAAAAPGRRSGQRTRTSHH